MTDVVSSALLSRLRMTVPIIQAPMTGYVTEDMVVAVADAGGLGSLPATLMSPEALAEAIGRLRSRTNGPIVVNFLAHSEAVDDPGRALAWRTHLSPFFEELGLDWRTPPSAMPVPVFGDDRCAVLEATRPDVVSFHLGLPPAPLVSRLRAAGISIVSSATTVEEARWLADHGCDAIIAQGLEAGGHRGAFLSRDLDKQCGTMALVPQIVDAVSLPVIAAGGISDPRGVAAALSLGASAVQIGTAFLFCPEAQVPPPYRAALRRATGADTVVTSIYSGLPARVIDNRLTRAMKSSEAEVVEFPLAMAAVAPLIAATLKGGSSDFAPLWAGQAVAMGKEMGAGELVKELSCGARQG